VPDPSLTPNPEPRTLWARVVRFLGLNASIGAMAAMVILIGLGEKMGERFLPLYLLALGSGTVAVGLLNSMQNFLGAIYSFPGGYLSDRLGYKKALILFTVVAMFGYLLVLLIPTWWAVFIGALFFIAWTAITLPAVMSMVAQVMPATKRAMGVSIHSFVRRIPMALGPVLGGLLIGVYGVARGVRVAFIAALVLGAAAILFVTFFMAEDPSARKKNPHPLGGFRSLTGPLRNLLVSDTLIRFAEQIPYAFVVVWVVKNNHISELKFGLLTTIEMVTAMLVYIPIAYLADKYGKKRFVLMTFGIFTIFPLVLSYSTTFAALVVAFIVRGLKEFGEPTRKALILDLAPDDAKAATFGTYYLVRDVTVSIAALSSAFLWNISPRTNFMVAFACGLLGTALFAVFGRDLQRMSQKAD
jgi:MFS family permease